mgnify:CR=1 FL=1
MHPQTLADEGIERFRKPTQKPRFAKMETIIP